MDLASGGQPGQRRGTWPAKVNLASEGGGIWYCFDDENVLEIDVFVIGNVYGWEGINETNCLAFYEQILE